MLIHRHPCWPRQRGANIIELMVVIAVIGILVMAAIPSFSTWIQNTQIRTAADVLQNGLQRARSEAVSRNNTVRFQLADTLTSSCALSISGKNSVVSLDDPTGACDATASDTTAPRIIEALSGTNNTPNAVVAASQAAVVFNGLGRVTPVPSGDITIDVTNPTGGACAASSGPMTCLRVVVTAGGQIKMCNPKFASTDPQGC